MNNDPTPWRELRVWNDDGENVGTLGELVDRGETGGITVADGGILAWPHHFIADDGETPDWDTPRGPVDWTGFMDRLAAWTAVWWWRHG